MLTNDSEGVDGGLNVPVADFSKEAVTVRANSTVELWGADAEGEPTGEAVDDKVIGRTTDGVASNDTVTVWVDDTVADGRAVATISSELAQYRSRYFSYQFINNNVQPCSVSAAALGHRLTFTLMLFT